MLYPVTDLFFAYKSDSPKLCYECKSLDRAEIDALIEALHRRFESIELGSFQFSLKDSTEYSKIERYQREHAGILRDSGIVKPNNSLGALELVLGLLKASNDAQQRWLDVYYSADALDREIHKLRKELSTGGLGQESVFAHVDRDELLKHLAQVECKPPVPVAGPPLSPERAREYATSNAVQTAPAHAGRSADSGDAGKIGKPPQTQTDRTVVLWEGAQHTERNIRLARTRTAYLEANENVATAMAALEAEGNAIGRTTFYEHLKVLDDAITNWR